ncbi:MAG: HD domain-containing phosphohydrolase [Actinomycetota bacterium]
MGEQTPSFDTWRARPALAAALRLFIMLVPIVASLAVTAALRRLVPPPHGPSWVGWALGLLTCALLVALGVERAGRRLLPLVTLLKLSMLFPDQAPTRFSIARTAGSVRKLESRLVEVQDDTASREESRTAATILSLSVALQSHDRRTRGHAERVRVFTDLLGEELQLPEEDRYRLRWAALMHDIGKLTISPTILNKPGALDDHEWRLMKGHPMMGAKIATPILGWLGPWADAIVEHHERFDAKGYPNGLAGGAISLGGRIVSVADSYDTMTAARSYKKPMAVWAARRELADCAGGQFDPEIVRAFLSISLPKLLWRTGPASLIVQLPFLGRLQQVGLQSVTVMTQGVAAATVAAGVTAMIVTGPTGASAHGHHRGSDQKGPNTNGAVAVPSPANPVPAPGGTSPSSAPSVPVPQPAPTPTTAPSPSGQPSEPVPTPTQPTRPGTPTPTPTTTSSPTPRPSPTSSPLPMPSVPPLPIPSLTPLPSLPPLPLPSLPPLSIPSLPPLPIPSLPPLPIPRPHGILPVMPVDAEDRSLPE